MFDQLFADRRTVQRYVAAPLPAQRLRYLHHRAEQGAAPATLKSVAAYQLAVIRTMDLQPYGEICSEEVHAAADRWVSRTPPHHARKGATPARAAFASTALGWLRFLERLREPRKADAPWAALLAEYAHYMSADRGLAPLTVYTRRRSTEEFLTRFSADGRRLRDLTLVDLDDAIARKGLRDGCTRASIRTYAYTLRAFVRYAERRQWCAAGLAAGILVPRVYASEHVPAGPSWDQVRRLCEDARGDAPAQIRDRALLLLFAVYGFRVGEVRRLRLDDIDWHAEVISVTRSKQRPRIQHYPLCQPVGDALVRYLRIRPRQCAQRQIFLSLKAPIRPLGNSALWQVVNRRLRRLDLRLRHQGPHALRHACATRLLQQGLSLHQIGDHLGHRTPAATRVYAKVDLESLRRVADTSLEGLL